MPHSSLLSCAGWFFRIWSSPGLWGKGKTSGCTRWQSINKPWKPGRSDIITRQLQWFVQEDKQIWIESKRKVRTGDYCGTLSSFKHLQNILLFSASHESVCGRTCFYLTSVESVSWLEVCFPKATLSWWFHVSVRMLFLCLCQVRHAAANVLRECWLLHRTNLKKGNGGEHRRHQRCLLEAIRVWVIVSLPKRFRPLVWIKGVSGSRLMARVFHVCILWIVKLASTCFGCRVTLFKGWLTYSMGFFQLFFLVFFLNFIPLHALTHFCYSLLSRRCIINCWNLWFRA